MSELVLNGKITEINATQVVSDKFSKRTFVLETGGDFSDTFQMEFQKDKCNLLDKFKVGDQVEVSYNLRGRSWTKGDKTSYFVTLAAWRISQGEESNMAPALDNSDDQSLPF